VNDYEPNEEVRMMTYEPHDEAPDLLSVQAAVARLAISEQTLMRHVKAGRVAAYKVGGSVRMPQHRHRRVRAAIRSVITPRSAVWVSLNVRFRGGRLGSARSGLACPPLEPLVERPAPAQAAPVAPLRCGVIGQAAIPLTHGSTNPRCRRDKSAKTNLGYRPLCLNRCGRHQAPAAAPERS
jgi:hypothetical protein